jgi:hypothetical protein
MVSRLHCDAPGEHFMKRTVWMGATMALAAASMVGAAAQSGTPTTSAQSGTTRGSGIVTVTGAVCWQRRGRDRIHGGVDHCRNDGRRRVDDEQRLSADKRDDGKSQWGGRQLVLRRDEWHYRRHDRVDHVGPWHGEHLRSHRE